MDITITTIHLPQTKIEDLASILGIDGDGDCLDVNEWLTAPVSQVRYQLEAIPEGDSDEERLFTKHLKAALNAPARMRRKRLASVALLWHLPILPPLLKGLSAAEREQVKTWTHWPKGDGQLPRKITLATLADASRFEVVQQSAEHLLRQNSRCEEEVSTGRTACRYRSGKKRCAAGVFISDREYNYHMEEQGVGSPRPPWNGTWRSCGDYLQAAKHA